jgi:hypothetical protein
MRVALGWLWGGFRVALGSHCSRMRVALAPRPFARSKFAYEQRRAARRKGYGTSRERTLLSRWRDAWVSRKMRENLARQVRGTFGFLRDSAILGAGTAIAKQ